MTRAEIIQQIAKWINDSVSAEQINRLADHVQNDRFESDEVYELSTEFVEAIYDRAGL